MVQESDTSVGPISYSEEAAWQEFVADKFTFFSRLFEFKVTLPGAGGVPMARRLIDELTSRHEIFRTGFRPAADGVVRLLLPSYEHEIVEADEPDFSVHPDPDQTELTPADLVTIWLTPGPDGQQWLWVDLNEMISDAVSSARLQTELEAMLEPAAAGQPLDLTAPAAAYADYAREQREQVLPERLREYWAAQLDGLTEPGYIQVDGPDAGDDAAGERIVVFPDDISEYFHAVCSRYRLSGFMAATALMNLVLAVRSGARDITLSTISSNRPRKWSDVQGNFSNLLLLRTVLPPDPSFAEIALLSRQTVLGGLGHKDISYLRLPEVLGREIALPPIRIHYLKREMHHYDVLDVKPSGAKWNEFATFATWPIELGFAEDARRRVSIWASFDPRLYTNASLNQLLDQCMEVLGVVGPDPDLTCRDVASRLGITV
jgi:hypothetical protein